MANSGARFIFLTSYPGIWGAEYSMLQIARGIADSGAEVEVWTGSADLLAPWNRDGRTGRLLSLGDRRAAKNARLLRELRTIPADSTVVVFEFELMPAIAIASPYLKLRRIRRAIDLNANMSQRGARKFNFLVSFFDVCICVSSYIAGQVSPRARAQVVTRPMPLPGNDFNAANRGEFTVGIVSRLDPEKQVELALQACAVAESAPLVVLRGACSMLGAAGADYQAQLVTLGEQLLGDRFRYDGRVPQETAMQGLDVLLHCNDAEPSGRVVAEAQLNGVIPIVPSTGGSNEFVVTGETGMVFEANNVDSAARCIDELAGSDSQRAKIATQAKSFGELRYNPAQQAAAYLTALRG